MVDLSKEEILERYKHLDQSDDFVGTQFPTPKGGVLTVVGWDGVSRKSKLKLYTVYCTICSEDVELWPDSIRIAKKYINNGTFPCGCSKVPNWKPFQMEIRVLRKCVENGYKFIKWKDGFYKNNNSKVVVYNKNTGNTWDTTTVGNLLRGHKDPWEIGRRDESAWISFFKEKGYYPQGTIFKRCNIDVNYWEIQCPICSFDEYVYGGVCSGVFRSLLEGVSVGRRPCRCSDKYMWSKEQREFKIRSLLMEEGSGVFDHWEGNKVVWFCSKCNYKCKTSPDKFINSGNRCPRCSTFGSNFNGYLENRKDDVDYLYVIYSPSWVKCGRTFNIKDRLRNIKSSSGLPCKVMFLYKGRHKDVYEIEQLVKEFAHEIGKNFYKKGEFAWKGNSECYGLDFIDNLGSILTCFNTLEPIKPL